MIKIGDQYTAEFTISTEQVQAFAAVSGDANPLHLDAAYAATTPFKKPIAHGMLSAAVISKVLGMDFPGQGTLYLSQQLDFKRPLYPDTPCRVELTVTDIQMGKHIATISTKIFETEKGKILVDGAAQVRHNELIP